MKRLPAKYGTPPRWPTPCAGSKIQVQLNCIDWKQYEALVAALGGDDLPHVYAHCTLEIPALLRGVSWKNYDAFLDALGDHGLRHSYDRGTLEVMSPRKDHDWAKRIIGRMIEALSLEMDLPIQSIGSTTLRKQPKRRGLEPDEAYYVASEPKVRGKPTYDPQVDPPPDLVVEVDVTSSSVPRMPLFASLGVPEIWRYDGKAVLFYRLTREGKYASIARSRAFPLLTPAVILRFLNQWGDVDETTLIKSFIRWARGEARKRH